MINEDTELFYIEGMMPKASDEVIAFVQHIVKWKMNDMPMFPEDVLNYMIQEGVITETEVIGVMIEHCLSDNKSVDIVLPTKYNV